MIKDFLVLHVSHAILIYANVSEVNSVSGTKELDTLVSCIILVLPVPLWNVLQAFDLKKLLGRDEAGSWYLENLRLCL